MTQSQNPTNRSGGYLIQNEKQNDRQPDLKGKVTIDGKEWLLSVWSKGQKDGKDFYSVSATDPATMPKRTPAAPGSQNTTGQNTGNQNTGGQGSAYPDSSGSGNQSNGSQGSNSQAEGVVEDSFGSMFDGLP